MTADSITSSHFINSSSNQRISHCIFIAFYIYQEKKVASSTRLPEISSEEPEPTSSSSVSSPQSGRARYFASFSIMHKTIVRIIPRIKLQNVLFGIPRYFCRLLSGPSPGSVPYEKTGNANVTGNYLIILSAPGRLPTPSHQAGMLHRHSSTPREQRSLHDTSYNRLLLRGFLGFFLGKAIYFVYLPGV